MYNFCVKQHRRKNYKNNTTMKKRITILSVVVLFAIVAASCSHKTCPAYRGSIAENVVVE